MTKSALAATETILTVGARVTGTYCDVPITGTVHASRAHTINWRAYLVFITLDEPTDVNGVVRDRVQVSVTFDGQDVGSHLGPGGDSLRLL